MTGVRDQHGGNIHAAARHHPGPLLDFSASINPLGPAPRALHALRRAIRELVHYPDPDCTVLREELARHHRLPAGAILVGNGAVELIHLIPSALRLRHALIIGPTFSEYATAVRSAGGRVHWLMAERSAGYLPPLAEPRLSHALEAVAGRGEDGMVILCNPNSPTGRAVDVPTVRRVAEAAAERRLWLLVDESFVDYCESRSVLRDIPSRPHVLVLRSFTKFHALPGLRAGYLAAAPEVIRRLRDRQVPWSVNTLAQAAAVGALADRAHARTSRRFIRAERQRLRRHLQALDVAVFPSAANFLLLELPEPWSATGVAAALRAAGILVRDCSAVPGLNDRTLRVAIRRMRENDRLVGRLRGILLGEGGSRCG